MATAVASEQVSGLIVETRPATGPLAEGSVEVVRLSDGTLVRLSGRLTHQHLPQLRRALLMPFTPEVRDVVLDLSGVTATDDSVVALLLAAKAWTIAAERRFALSARSAAVDTALRTLCGDAGVLPSLVALPRQSAPRG